MKYAQKMMLIPEEEYLSLSSKPKNTFKRDMTKLLKGKRDHEAATKMSQLVGTYLRHKQNRNSSTTSNQNNDTILKHFEAINHAKVDSFLSQLQDNQFSWNDKKELILPSGKILQHSNIIDLIKEALLKNTRKKRTTPFSWKVFIDAVASSSIPKSFFTKRSTLKDLAQSEQDGWEMF